MIISQHIPGPWDLDFKACAGSDRAVVNVAGSPAIAVVYRTWSPEGKANARLVAAAPDLAEATRVAEQLAVIAADWNLSEVEIDGEMRSIRDVREIFRAALSKVAGEA